MFKKFLLLLPVLFSLLLGLVFGVIWGESIANKQKLVIKNTQIESTREFNMLYTLIYAARADGAISPNKGVAIIRIFQNMGYDPETLSQIKDDLGSLAYQPIDIHTVIAQFKSVSDPKARLLLFQCASLVSFSDGSLSAAGKIALQTIYSELGL
jgi:uncharacterized membrane protein YebE (DUF533 family)